MEKECITGAFHRAKRISTDFEKDIKTLETPFIKTGYPKRFISHTINNFLTDSSQDDNIIPDFQARGFSSSRFAVKTKN